MKERPGLTDRERRLRALDPGGPLREEYGVVLPRPVLRAATAVAEFATRE